MAHALAHLPPPAPTPESFLAAVLEGLSQPQKTLPCKYLYDEVGSFLFEAICALPEYGLTRADDALLARHAGAIAGAFATPLLVAELGSGSGMKTRHLLAAAVARGAVAYVPIEISPAALSRARSVLSGVAGLEYFPLEAEYLDGLAQLARLRQVRWPARPLLLLFLGSTLGNFAPAEQAGFLLALRRHLRSGDGLLVGTDLAKPPARLRAAYDDPAGVSAAFNLNLLVRCNRELGADFDLRHWRHLIRLHPRGSAVEMHLYSCRAQMVRIAGHTFAFRRGETIWTEISRKYRSAAIRAALCQAGFTAAGQWSENAWGFAETLVRVPGSADPSHGGPGKRP